MILYLACYFENRAIHIPLVFCVLYIGNEAEYMLIVYLACYVVNGAIHILLVFYVFLCGEGSNIHIMLVLYVFLYGVLHIRLVFCVFLSLRTEQNKYCSNVNRSIWSIRTNFSFIIPFGQSERNSASWFLFESVSHFAMDIPLDFRPLVLYYTVSFIISHDHNIGISNIVLV